MPDTAENQAVYPQQSSQKEGLGFPICRLVAVLCLGSGALLNAAMAPYSGKGTGESSLLREMIDSFKKGNIVLGDAIYGDYFLLAEMIKRGVDVVFEQMGSRKKSTDFRVGKKLGARDHLIEYIKPKKPVWMTKEEYLTIPETLTVRELKTGGKILVTTLLSPSYASKKALKKLYNSRWNVELDLRNIKTTLGMESLSCRSPEMAKKEIWVYFLAYNMIRIVMAEAASLADVLPRMISFKHSLQLWRTWSLQSAGIDDSEKLHILFMLVAENIVGKRPGRVEPRTVKRRPKPFPRLTESRERAREKVRKNGHPKKQK